VLHACSELRLAEEALAESFVPGEAWTHELEGDSPPEPSLLREVHGSHATSPEKCLDPVIAQLRPHEAIGERCPAHEASVRA
jgi:hypothetical protein